MRKLLVIAALLGALWGGYWFIGSSAMERGLVAWIGDRQTDGWVAEYATLDTRGFPSRFDTTITDLELADPRTGIAWSAPWFQILSLSYRPYHVIAVWPDKQVLATPHERIEISAAGMRGSIVLEPQTSLPLDRSSIVAERVELGSSAGWAASMEQAQLATRRTPAVLNSYDFSLDARGVRPASGFVELISRGVLLPEVFGGLEIRATVEFDAPWDRFAIERARPQPRRIQLDILKAQWGELDLWMAGELTVDRAGLATGEITVKAKNWRDMVTIAVGAGVLSAEFEGTVTSVLEFLSGLSGDKETLDTPLKFDRGRVWFGPVPLGQAPRFVIR
ncbi:DUF2125 domain-containing protein [Aliiroseovarius sp.]|uniref:DUF2125 domain-containing protein n=1 Tax=Aliiroseovarius sp. TaxID=1872442 RepID=UPI00260C0B31|nr:DUF2125 domain-containing protein [Aliiroseovarius sp.]